MSYQSKLGEGDSIAEELEESQRQISISEFFDKNKQMLGFDSESRGIVTAVKEAVDNSLDAAEEAGYLPEISVEIKEAGEYYTLIVEDNGPGITEEQIPKVFGKLLYGSRFHAREQSRGQQGIGISAAVMYAQSSSGKPAKITSKPENREARYFELGIDTDKNEPEIKKSEPVEWDKEHGIRIELQMTANMRSRDNLHEYIRNTAVVNPHTRIEFNEPSLDEPMVFERATDQLPDETEEIKPHPHGVELGSLQTMLQSTDSYSVSGFLQEEFTRVGQKTADTILDRFRDHHFGREAQWEPPEDRDEIITPITEVVNNKGKEDTRKYANFVADGIYDNGRVAYTDIEEIVEDAAEEASENFGRAFGATVRERTVESVWGVVRQEPTLTEELDNATSKRKDDEAVEAFAERLTTILTNTERHRVQKTILQQSIETIAGDVKSEYGTSFGETSQEKIFDAVWDVMRTVNDEIPNTNDFDDDRDIAAHLLEGMQETNVMAPPSSCLSPIKEDLIVKGLQQVYDADFFSADTRDADSHSGEPFVAEAGIAYGGDLTSGDQAEILRFANRVPLVYQRGACATTDVVKRIDWRNYDVDQTGGSGIPTDEIVILVHVASTNVPFTSESKDAIANVEALEDEIERAIRGAARELKSHLKKKKNLKKRRERQSIVARVLPQIAEKSASVIGEEPADINGSLAKIMNSIMVDTDGEELHMKNYNGKEEFELHLNFGDDKPTYPSQNVEREETEEGWRLVWEGVFEKGEEVDISWNSDSEPEVSLENIPREKVTFKGGDSE